MNKRILFFFQIILYLIIIILLIRLNEYKKANEYLNTKKPEYNINHENDSVLYLLINRTFPFNKINIPDSILERPDILRNNIFLFIPELNCLTCLERSLTPFFVKMQNIHGLLFIITTTDNPRYLELFKRNNTIFLDSMTIFATRDENFLKVKSPFFFTLSDNFRIVNIKNYNKNDIIDNVNYCFSLMTKQDSKYCE